MKLSLNKISEFSPCGQTTEGKTGISKLAKYLGKDNFNDKEEFDLMQVLKSNGIEDAVWCLRCFDYLDICLFCADVAESVLNISETKGNSLAPRNAINGIRDYKAGKINKSDLQKLTTYAAVAAYADAVHAANAAAAAAAAADAAYAADDTRKEKWNEIEQLFIKHFGE